MSADTESRIIEGLANAAALKATLRILADGPQDAIIALLLVIGDLAVQYPKDGVMPSTARKGLHDMLDIVLNHYEKQRHTK